MHYVIKCSFSLVIRFVSNISMYLGVTKYKKDNFNTKTKRSIA